MTCHDASQLASLPIRPRPAAGEPVSSYVRRLARANHLRPSYLHGCLTGPPDYLRAISPERLAIMSGRTAAVLERTLAGLARLGRLRHRAVQRRRQAAARAADHQLVHPASSQARRPALEGPVAWKARSYVLVAGFARTCA
jgi:hypothetical protein